MSVSQVGNGEATSDPRVDRTRTVVHAATLDLLADVGLGGLTMDGIASRARVGRSTLYRHWPDLGALVREAVASRPSPTGEPALDDPLDEIARLLDHLTEAMADRERSRHVAALAHAADQDRTIAAAHHADNEVRRLRLVHAIEAAVEHGAVPADTDPRMAAVALAGAIVYARTMTEHPLDSADVPALVRQVLGVQLSR